MLVHLSVPASGTPETALKHRADALWLDGDPAAAAEFVRAARRVGAGLRLYVRVSGLDGPIEAELDALMPAAPDGIVLPARGGADVQHLGVKLAVREAELGIADRAMRIIALAGATPGAIFQLPSFAGASARLVALAFDASALAASLGTNDDAPGAPLTLARNLTLFAAKAAGVSALLVENGAMDLTIFSQQAKQAAFDGIVTARADAIAAIRAAR
ncbi:HpcH/HpaI aldolase/citrate lyase family protein [Methylovirgula ligni]|uniref:HpcH/HpaI aldolase/citrate lyase family protein n=1 Tax=Methylovirgula ligni TaxID=569860 RepID=A0A3D9Z1K8_9HYPH|nr:aldolase/citrate lyase family protein [Methylovirgula ligni]REF87978.1 HpcH/HpaI aldolase/citrate lyase family protein [Methylovirgula ligni]